MRPGESPRGRVTKSRISPQATGAKLRENYPPLRAGFPVKLSESGMSLPDDSPFSDVPSRHEPPGDGDPPEPPSEDGDEDAFEDTEDDAQPQPDDPDRVHRDMATVAL